MDTGSLKPGDGLNRENTSTPCREKKAENRKKKRKKRDSNKALRHWRPQDVILGSVHRGRGHPLPHRHARISSHLGGLRIRSLRLRCKSGCCCCVKSCRMRHVARRIGHRLHLLLQSFLVSLQTRLLVTQLILLGLFTTKSNLRKYMCPRTPEMDLREGTEQQKQSKQEASTFKSLMASRS